MKVQLFISSSYLAENTLHLCHNKNENDVLSEVVNRLHPGLSRRVRKFREATISFVMFVCLSVAVSIRVEQLNSQRTNFHEI
jgi:hypothetical protein